MVPLAFVQSGELVEIVEIQCGKRCAFRLQEMGITAGSRYRIARGCGDGPLILTNGENRIGLGFGMAAKVIVQSVKGDSDG